LIIKYITIAMVCSNLLYGAFNEREFKAIDENFKDVSDKFIVSNKDIKLNISKIMEYIKDDKFSKAEMLTNKLLDNTTDDFTRGQLLNIYAIILEKTTEPKTVIAFIENNIELKKITNSNIGESYYLLLKNYAKLNNSKKTKMYYNIINDVFHKNKYIREKSDIVYAKFLLSLNNFAKANKLLENVFYNTKYKENAAASSLVLINLYFEKKQISPQLIEKYLSKIFKYNKKFFLNHKTDIFKNLDLFSKLDSKTVQDILVYLFNNIDNNRKYSKNWKKIGFILYKKYLRKQEYAKAKDILMKLLAKYTWINKNEIKFIKNNLQYIYELTEVKPVLKYKKNHEKDIVIDFFIKQKKWKYNHLFLLKNLKKYKEIDRTNYDYFFFDKKKMVNSLIDSTLDYYIINDNQIDFKDKLSRKTFLDILLQRIDTLIDKFPINLRIIAFFIENKYYGYNSKLFEKFKYNTNDILNRALITLFLDKNYNYSLSYLDKMIETPNIDIKEKKYFFLTKMNLLFLNKSLTEINKNFKLKDKFLLTTKEKIDLYFKYYLIIKNSPADDSKIEDTLINLINLSISINDTTHRPFIDFELVEILLSNREYKKSLLILDAIPKKHFLSDEYKAELSYSYANIYYHLHDYDNAKINITDCLQITDDSLWVQSCQFLKNRIYSDTNNK